MQVLGLLDGARDPRARSCATIAPRRSEPRKRYAGCRSAVSTSMRASRCAEASRIVVRIEARRLLSATRFNARSVTWPSARVSCTISSTTAGEVAIAMAAAMPACTGGKSKARSVANTAPKVRRLSARPGGGERPVALHPLQVHAPAEVEEHQADREVDEDARLVEQRIEAHRLRERRQHEAHHDVADDARQLRGRAPSRRPACPRPAARRRAAGSSARRAATAGIQDSWTK